MTGVMYLGFNLCLFPNIIMEKGGSAEGLRKIIINELWRVLRWTSSRMRSA